MSSETGFRSPENNLIEVGHLLKILADTRPNFEKTLDPQDKTAIEWVATTFPRTSSCQPLFVPNNWKNNFDNPRIAARSLRANLPALQAKRLSAQGVASQGTSSVIEASSIEFTEPAVKENKSDGVADGKLSQESLQELEQHWHSEINKITLGKGKEKVSKTEPRFEKMIDTPFTPAQQAQMNQAIQAAVFAAIQNFTLPVGMPDIRNSEGYAREGSNTVKEPPIPAYDSQISIRAFRARDIGFFDPDNTKDQIEVKESYNIYHNVFSFTNRLRVKATSPEFASLARHIDTCLLGNANAWYTKQIDNTTRIGLRHSSVENWCNMLEKRFRNPPGKALAALEVMRYTTNNVREGIDPMKYISDLILLGRDSGIATSESAQLILAYEHLDGELRRDIQRPTEFTTIASFITDLRYAYDTWADIYGPKRTFRPNYGDNHMNDRSARGLYKPNRYSHYQPQPQESANARRQNSPPRNQQLPNNRRPLRWANSDENLQNKTSQGPSNERQYNRPRHFEYRGQSYKKAQRAYGGNVEELEEKTRCEFEEDGIDPANNIMDDEGHDDMEAYWNLPRKPQRKPTVCRRCHSMFDSGNAFHKHRETCRKTNPISIRVNRSCSTVASENVTLGAERPIIVKSSASEGTAEPGHNFKGYRYATAKVRFEIGGLDHDVCLDTGCTMSLADEGFIREHVPGVMIAEMPLPIPVTDNKGRMAMLERELHLVKSLKANVLIGVDILVPEKIDILLDEKIAVLHACDDIRVSLQITTRGRPLLNKVTLHKSTSIPPDSYMALTIKCEEIPDDRDFIFEPATLEELSVCAHIVNHTFSDILVYNPTGRTVRLNHNSNLGRIKEYAGSGCYLVTAEELPLALNPPNRYKQWDLRKILATANSATISATISPEIIDASGVTSYHRPGCNIDFREIVTEFPNLWRDTGNVIGIRENLEIPLVDNWKELYKACQARVYPVGRDEQKIIDSVFDKLHDQNRMEWTKRPTPFSFPVFVVYRDMATKKAGRVVVDIRALNKITLKDAYPVPLQAEILAATQGCDFLSTVDCSSFFYQWWVKPEHRHRLTVSTHRGQETFKVPVMGFRNSVAYVQRMIDNILRDHREYCRVYIDDIVIFSQTAEDHAKHLRAVFAKLNAHNITLSPHKSFIGYPSIKLLGQKVDALGLATADDKIAAISNFKFPNTLAKLETYLGLTGWLRQYIPFYAAIVDPLQARKTLLSKSITQNRQRKSTASRTELLFPTAREKEAFDHLQGMFKRSSILVHYDNHRQTYIDIDASKEFGVGVMIYHVKDTLEQNRDNASLEMAKNNTGKPLQKSVQPIMFLSRMLSMAEKNYWPTELEVAALVWTVKKVRHIIEAAETPVIVYTDHSATTSIARQTSLNTVSVEKLNLRLVLASEYLQRFHLDIRHKSGKLNIVPDAISRLDINSAV
ncbi:hypothetical protein K3495_g10831 [Podosphaera aphanis]|nr:hypothetical protein K3495_g10831 [Podosphaera aphanis]